MDEKEIQATMDRLAENWMRQQNAATTLEAFKLATDALCKFTRLVEAVECIADCHLDVAAAFEEETLETARTEGSC